MNESLDYAFLRYMGVSASSEKRFHSFYLPYFANTHRILELGCGMGGFVKLLHDAGKDVYGIDSDPHCVAETQRLGLQAVEADVLDHLRGLEPESLDAIFSAHLVEHLPYQVVMEVIRLSHQALRPGGRLLMVTPNPRALISHLEFYHLHFGHVAFYQPELLAFFMSQCGFAQIQMGENPDTNPEHIATQHPIGRLSSSRLNRLPLRSVTEILPKPSVLWKQLIWYPKMWLIHWLVQPLTDQLAGELHRVDEQLHHLNTTVNRAFECFAIGDKAHS